MIQLTSQFEVGAYTFRGCVSCVTNKSMHSYKDTASLRLPSTAVLKSDYIELPSRQTAKQFEVGDYAVINLGYDGNPKREFVGFVSRLNYTQPVELEMEGYSWLLRYHCNVTQSWKSTTLKAVLSVLVEKANEGLAGRDVPRMELHPDIPDIPLKNIVINDASGTETLDYLKGVFKGILTIFFLDNVLYAGLSYADIAQTAVKYRLNWNTIGANNLRFHRADETEVQVNLKFRNGAGEQIVTTTGKPGGIKRTDRITAITDENIVKQVAEAKLLQESFDGYEGSINCFLVPYCQPGYRAEIIDTEYNEREGNYFVESVNVTYGGGGGRRIVELGLKLS